MKDWSLRSCIGLKRFPKGGFVFFAIFISAGWLDDIGLPQYKDQFHESRVDGRMLQYLTVVRWLAIKSLSSIWTDSEPLNLLTLRDVDLEHLQNEFE